jgi:hypothetical protein
MTIKSVESHAFSPKRESPWEEMASYINARD